MKSLSIVCLVCTGCATTQVGTPVRVAETAAEEPTATSSEWTPGPLFWAGVGSAGAGAVSLVVSFIYGGKVKDTESEIDALVFDGTPGPDDPVCTRLAPDNTCAEGPLADLDARGSRQETVQLVTLVAGVGLLVTGAVLGSIDVFSETSVAVAPLSGGAAMVLTRQF